MNNLRNYQLWFSRGGNVVRSGLVVNIYNTDLQLVTCYNAIGQAGISNPVTDNAFSAMANGVIKFFSYETELIVSTVDSQDGVTKWYYGITTSVSEIKLEEGRTGSDIGISGNTLTVMAATDPQIDYDRVAVDDLLGEPSATNNVWVSYKGINFEQSRMAVAAVLDATGGYCVIATSAAHGLTAGDYVRLVGMSVPAYNSGFATAYEVLTVPTSTTFAIKMTYSATATGVAIKQAVLTTSNSYVGVKCDSNTKNLVIV